MTRTGTDGPFRADLGSFPLVRFTSPHVAECDGVDVPSYFQNLDRALAENQLFVILHDMRGNPPVADQNRQDFVQSVDERRKRIESLVVAYAAVCSSPLERAIITAFTWFTKLPMPIRIFTSETEARAWLSTRYETALRVAQKAARAVAE